MFLPGFNILMNFDHDKMKKYQVVQ